MSEMSEPISPTFAPDRVYQFISDPSHKENLSGRVRAACLTCRRKKIKCSGELNCRTCREKGLVCEGLPERKRPSKDPGSSIILEPVATGRIERRRKSGSPKKPSPPQRPCVLLNTRDNDSGYGSAHMDATDIAVSPASSGIAAEALSGTRNEELAIRSAKSASKSPAPRIHTWQLSDQTAEPAESPFATEVSRPLAAFRHAAPPHSAEVLQAPIDWSPATEGNPWWPKKPGGDAPSLISAAQALEEQAHSLRIMANRQSTDCNSDTSRRQTIAFPLPSPPEAFEPRFDMLHNHNGIFDDMALLFANRAPGTNITPGLAEFAPWWNVDDIDFLQAHHNMHDPLVPSEQQQQQHQQRSADLSATTTAPDLTTLAAHSAEPDGNFLAQFWPD